MMDLDMALREDEPPKTTNESIEAMRAHYAKWERSNRLSLISIKRPIAEHLLGGIPESNNAKEFLVAVANKYQTSDNVEAGHFMDELMNMRYDDMKGVHEYILKMVHLQTRLKALDIPILDKFIVHQALNTLPSSFSQIKTTYNTLNQSWGVNDLITKWDRNLRKPSEKESKLKVGSDIGIDVEHIGVSVLELDSVIKIVRSDRGGEYYGKHGDAGQQKGPFARYFQDNGIVAQYTMPVYLWGEAIKTTTYILNRVPTEVKIYDPSLKRTDSRTTRCYFIGYPSHSKGYKFYCLTRGTRIVESQVVKFLELDVADSIPSQSNERVEPMDVISLRLPVSDVNLDVGAFDSGIQQGVATVNFPIVEINPIVDEIPPMEMRRSQRTRRLALSNDYYVYLGEGEYDIGEEVDPNTYCEALSSDKANEWLIAMRDEMQSMSDNDVWELVDLPKGYKPIGCKWVFKTKRDNKGNVERCKARLVARGYTQREGIDFTETFSPVSTKDYFRLVMALVAHFDLELHQMDVKIAFLNENKFNQCVYMKVNGSKYIFMVLYIDDILLASSNVNLLNDTKRILSANFDMKDLGEASFVLGIEIYRDRSRNLLGLSQIAYINRVLKRFNMQMCKAGDVPVVNGDKLSNEQCPKNDLEKNTMKTISYASAISSLMYAQVCTRPNIAFIVNVLRRYLSNPGHDHWVAAKKVMRYLQRTKDFMLVYRRVDNLEVVGYSDSDFGGCSDDRKSTLGYIFMLAVVFYSKNNKISTGSKHMEIKYLTVKDLVKKGDIVIEHIRTESMLADPLTKCLKPITFKEHVVNMGVIKSFDSLV
ncbi:Retrovirus-related Pol polyprotein from transposon TNT 1-94 [Vitis vinifera]|uniref:Retrovirus-related Pol polyprotein from transposon TNT 1-94 n=1 Tax=Vitis vinifera TaxID=29760 RepID=A0A438FXS9_VITVI|nr:Retrovirus-related Pol polyprotein from transposon TNT 1-94 [Vitis vinifera]